MKISGDDTLQETLDKGGIKPDTKRKRDVSQKLFEEYLENKGTGPMEIFFFPDSYGELQDHLMEFFDRLRTNTGELPSRSYFESIKSGLKMRIMELTHDKIDISNMKKLSQVSKEVYKRLKEMGKGDVKAHPRPCIGSDLQSIW